MLCNEALHAQRSGEVISEVVISEVMISEVVISEWWW